MGNKKKYYAILKGHKTGIYDKWFGDKGAEVQINGFSGAVFKKFSTIEDALIWLQAHSNENKLSTSKAEPEHPNSSKSGHCTNVRKGKPNKNGNSESSKPDQSQCQAEGRVIMYTDGGCIRNPGPGGFGVVLKFKGHRKEISGGYRKTTNNRMELMACIEGLKALKKRCSVVIHSDSRYVINGIEKGWAVRWRSRGWMRTRTEPAENVDLWEELLKLCERHDVIFKWVKGHSGNPENERCDQLAGQSALKNNLPPDTAYETGKTKTMTAAEFFNS